MSPTSLLYVLFLAIAAVANPIVRDNFIRLPFAKHINIADPAHVVRNDQARAAALRAQGQARASGVFKRDAVNVPVQNQAVTYVASVGVGSPATTYSLLIDTGSSNTWVGAGQNYVRTKTSKATGNTVHVRYGSGFFAGSEFTDTVTLAEGLVITAQSIGAAAISNGFQGLDGILGIGPVDLTKGTLLPDIEKQIPTVTNNLFSQGTIPQDLIGVSFEPTNTSVANNGELTFGGIDNSKFTGSITFTPLTTTSPANEFWGIDQSITYGAAGTPILSSTAGIVDTGTTLLLIATDALANYEAATGAVPDATTGLLKITPAQFNSLESLFFLIGGTTFEFTADAQAWPRALNSLIGGTADNVYLIVGDAGANTGSGLDFINGFAFLERYFLVLDTTGGQVGFATTEFTHSLIN